MELLTLIILGGSVLAAAATGAEIQRRLLAKGGRWLPSTIMAGLSGYAVLIAVPATYIAIGGIILDIVR